MGKITVNSFVRRQTPDSRFSHYSGSWEGLTALVEAHLDQAKPGYRDGVILVPVPPEGFFSSIVPTIPESPLQAKCEARTDKEEPVIVVTTSGHKTPAGSVDVVLYRHDVLVADGDAESDSEWEVVSINANPLGTVEVPMHPVAMARNFLHLKGGTEAVYTAEEFAQSIWFWATHAQVG